MIDPDDPKLPMEWRKQLVNSLEVAALTNTRPKDWRSADWKLEEACPGWYISHGFDFDNLEPLLSAKTPEESESRLARLPDLLKAHHDTAIQRVKTIFQTRDYRKLTGIARLFSGSKDISLRPDQRQNLVTQLDTVFPLDSSGITRRAFVELEGGYAVAGVIYRGPQYLNLVSHFLSPTNPVLTLVGREVVVNDYFNEGDPIAAGLLELEGNNLKVDAWRYDFSQAVVQGTPFEEAELLCDGFKFLVHEKTYFQSQGEFNWKTIRDLN